MTADERCPVTILTGFLGSGKTTLLNALIHNRTDLRIAVLVNEFGELGIDAGLIDTSQEDIIQLSNGCLCCTVRGDILSACARLAARREDFDWLVVETSGLADPAPVAQSFLLADGASETFRLDGIVTVVDAANVSRNSGILARQIAMADRLILTKTDIVESSACERVVGQLRRQNPGADIVLSSDRTPGFAALTDIRAYDLDKIPERLCFVPPPRHDAAITSESFSFEKPFDFTAFSSFIKSLLAQHGEDILRVKGIVDLAGENRRFAFHGVQSLIDGDVIGPWEKEPRQSTLVFIGRNLDRPSLENALNRCLA